MNPAITTSLTVAKIAQDPLSSSALDVADAETESLQADHLTNPGTMVGTVAYMSPEQLQGRELDTTAAITDGILRLVLIADSPSLLTATMGHYSNRNR